MDSLCSIKFVKVHADAKLPQRNHGNIKRTSTNKVLFNVVTTQPLVEDMTGIKSEIEKVLSPTNPLGTTLNLYNHEEK